MLFNVLAERAQKAAKQRALAFSDAGEQVPSCVLMRCTWCPVDVLIPHRSRCDACLSPSFPKPQGREDEDEGVDVLLIEVCEAPNPYLIRSLSNPIPI